MHAKSIKNTRKMRWEKWDERWEKWDQHTWGSKYSKALYLFFIDMEKAFDKVPGQ